MSDRRFEYCQAILSKLKNGEKHNKRTIEKLAAEFTIYNKNLVKEMTELAVVLIAREISNNSRFTNYEKYQQIVELYYQQVNLSHRTSQSTLFQQYSTPAPISYVASLYVHQNHSESGLYFEPSAGNGLLTIAIPYHQVIVNELDDVRLENLKHQPYKNVTRVDATNPFIEYYKKFDGIITNPPFGSLMNAENYDGYPIKTLDHLMALRALDTMKDDGRAAIIIGGHTEWDEHGRTQAGKNRLLFNYLYSHYNVEDVVLIDGHKLYSRQGTSFNVRLILINGRKQIIEGVAPLKNNALSEVVGSFDVLWHRVFGDESERADKTKDEKIRIAKAKAKAKLKLLQISSLNGLDIADPIFSLNHSFNLEYQLFKEKKLNKTYLTIGKAGLISSKLIENGVKDNLIVLSTNNIAYKTKKHNLEDSNILDLPLKLSQPLIISDYIDINGNLSKNIFISDFNKEGLLVVGMYCDVKQNKTFVNKIATIHGRNENQLMQYAKKSSYINCKKIKELFSDRSINCDKFKKFLNYIDNKDK